MLNKKTLVSPFPVQVANDIPEICILSRDRIVGELEAKTWFTTATHVEVSKGAKIRNRYNQVPHPTQDTNGKVTK